MDVSKLGNHLKTRRKAAGLTQADLAARVNVSRKSINTIENQVFVPSTILALRLARELKCSVEDLFFEIEE
ncbi:MAG: helix-turn-helix transcriptional regulator [Lentilitoribacter sp.]